MQTLDKLGVEGHILYLIKGIYRKPIVNITLHGARLDAVLVTSGARQRCPRLAGVLSSHASQVRVQNRAVCAVRK